MRATSLRRKVLVLLLLTAVLPASWAGAARRPTPSARPPAAAPAPQNLFRRIAILLTSVWAKAGCHINPNGLCVTGTAPAPSPATQVEAGCHIDPNGRCGS